MLHVINTNKTSKTTLPE